MREQLVDISSKENKGMVKVDYVYDKAWWVSENNRALILKENFVT